VKKVASLTMLDESAIWQDLEKVKVSKKDEALVEKRSGQISRTEQIERKIMSVYFDKEGDTDLEQKLREITGEEKLQQLKQKYEPIKQEIVFENEMTETEDGTFREMLRNLEEDYLARQIDDLKLELRHAEIKNDEVLAEKLSIECQKLVKKLADIKNSRYLNKY
jgi:hypothetical protein